MFLFKYALFTFCWLLQRQTQLNFIDVQKSKAFHNDPLWVTNNPANWCWNWCNFFFRITQFKIADNQVSRQREGLSLNNDFCDVFIVVLNNILRLSPFLLQSIETAAERSVMEVSNFIYMSIHRAVSSSRICNRLPSRSL